MKKDEVQLKCGVWITLYPKHNSGFVDMSDFYFGFNSMNDFKRLSELFLELDEMGYKPAGIYLVQGCYDSIEAMNLDITKK